MFVTCAYQCIMSTVVPFSRRLRPDFLNGNITQSIFCLHVDNVKSLPARLEHLFVPLSIYTSCYHMQPGRQPHPKTARNYDLMFKTALWPMDGWMDGWIGRVWLMWCVWGASCTATIKVSVCTSCTGIKLAQLPWARGCVHPHQLMAGLSYRDKQASTPGQLRVANFSN